MAPERWTTEQTWALIREMLRKPNMKVLFGPEVGENTSGDSKNVVYRRISVALNPEVHQANPTKSADRVKNRINWLQAKFKEHAGRLKKTGEGVQGYYQVLPDGPDHDTDNRAVNIWEQIKNDFEYFPDLWKVWSTKPNLVPICATTGVGPTGQHTVYIQPPPPPPSGQQALVSTISDSQIDPWLLNMSTNSETPSAPVTPRTPVPASSADKENAPPSSGRRGPRPSSLSASGSSEKITLLPQKRGFEDEMVSLSRDMMDKLDQRADETHQAKKRKYDRLERQQLLGERKLLLEEFQAGVLSRKRYKKKYGQINARIAKLDGEEPELEPDRSSSPDWDMSLIDQDKSGDEL